MARKTSEFLSAFGTAFEIWKALVEAVFARGGTDDDLRRILREKSLRDELAKLIVKCGRVFYHDKTNDGWTLLEDVGFNPAIEISKLETVSFLLQGETYIGGEDMAKRARDFFGANLGQLHAEYLLEHQNEIPMEWRKYVLVFPGTMWRVSFGGRRAPCLYWGNSQWDLRFDWLGYGWGSSCRLVRPSK